MSSSRIPHRGRIQPPPNPGNANTRANATELARLLIRLEQMNAQSISACELRELFGVVPQSLDLITGKPCRHGEAFIKPVLPGTLQSWIAYFEPEKEVFTEASGRNPFEFEDPFPAGPNERDPTRESIDMKNRMLRYVRYSKDWKMGNILEQKTRWHSFMMDWDHLYRGDSYNDWQVSEVFITGDQRSRDPTGRSFDPSSRHPHVQAWLHDVIPVANELSLTVAELSTVLALALSVIRRAMYRRALMVPITVISCSDRQLRIVQGAIDFQNGTVDIRISPMIDFGRGGLCTTAENKLLLCRVLGWVCGDPVGNVMP